MIWRRNRCAHAWTARHAAVRYESYMIDSFSQSGAYTDFSATCGECGAHKVITWRGQWDVADFNQV